jgi:uncharacterized membrane-anchored protein YhcB (DUF1043 family)
MVGLEVIELNAMDWGLLGTVGILIGALYLRLTNLLDETSQRLQDVALRLENHGQRLDQLERHR